MNKTFDKLQVFFCELSIVTYTAVYTVMSQELQPEACSYGGIVYGSSLMRPQGQAVKAIAIHNNEYFWRNYQ